MKRISIVISFLLFSLSINAQFKINRDSILNKDSLVKYNNLKFANTNEEKSFKDFIDTKNINSGLKLLFYSKNESFNFDSIENVLNKHISVLKNKTTDLSEKKKIRVIYDYIHNLFFDKYSYYAMFPDIFINKTYNCLTASILYAYFLEKLEIPYEARLSNEHVYLLAYPGSFNIVMETTNPLSEISQITEKFKKEYINQLRELKLISQDEFSSLSVNDLFSKYYFQEDNVKFYDLIGSHYLNLSSLYIEKFNYYEAFKSICKSHLISPYYKTIYSIIVVGAEIIQKNQYLKNEDAEILAILSRFTDYGISNEMVYSDFKTITQNQLMEKNDTLMYSASYNSLIISINDTNLKSDISHYYFKSLSLHYLKLSDYENALSSIEKAFYTKSDNVESLMLLSDIFGAYFSKYYENQDNYDEMYERIQKYYLLNNEIKNTKTLGSFRLYYWIYKSNIQLNKLNIAEADKYLSQFEKLLPSKQTSSLSFDIQNIYIKFSMYYYKKYNNKKAKEYISRGLKILPDNYELNRHFKAL